MYDDNSILGDVRKLKNQYDTEVILSLKGYNFTQRGLIELIENYWDSKFISGDRDKDGLFRFFYNMIKFPARLASKLIDFDTKDFRFFAEAGQSYVPVYFFNKELKAWMKDQDFGFILNRIVKGVPKYGNYVLKSVNGETSPVRLKNLVSDPYCEFLNQSYLLCEEHYMTPLDLDAMRCKWNDQAIDKVLEAFKKNKTASYIKVDECFIYGKENEFVDGSKSEKLVRGLCVVANLDDCKYDKVAQKYMEDNAVTLFKGVKKDLPYYEFFWDEFQGTWLRSGIVVELLEEQFSMNDSINLERKGLYWTSKKLYQTKDMLVAKNLMLDVENGDILRVSSEITPIVNEERNLAAYRNQLDIWDKNRREKTMTFESISGENSPSGTPFRLGFIQQKAAS